MRTGRRRSNHCGLPVLDEAALTASSARVAPKLAALGLQEGTSLVVVSRNRVELLVLHVAGRSLGASVAFIDPDSPAADADSTLKQLEPTVVVCEYGEQVPFVRALLPSVQIIVLVGASAAAGVSAWSDLVDGDVVDPPVSTVPERVMCDAHLAEPATAVILRDTLGRGAAVCLVPPGFDRHAVAALAPTTLITSPSRLEAMARELRRRAPLRRPGEGRSLRWPVVAALPSFAWAFASLLGIGTSSGRASFATAIALVVAVASQLAGGRRSEVIVVGIAAAVALGCAAAGSAPSLVAAARFCVAVVPAIVVLRALGAAQREIAWLLASRAAHMTGGSPLGAGLGSLVGRFVSGRVRAALGFPVCARVLVVGGAPDAQVAAALAVTGLDVSCTRHPVPLGTVAEVLLSGAGEVG